jgi:hypothetical protein
MTMCEPSLVVRTNVFVPLCTSLKLFNDSPNHELNCPLAETPLGLSGVNVTVPSSRRISAGRLL